jgi:hypothetical protein
MTTGRFWVAFTFAPAVAAAAFCVLLILTDSPSAYDVLGGFVLASLVTYAHAIVLGLPVILILRHLHRFTRLTVVAATFLIGALPVALFTAYSQITNRSGTFTVNGVAQQVDGRLTLAGWLSNIEGVLMCGAFGAVAGIFLWWLSGASANNALEQTRGRQLR